jgi:hypothetical protein
MAKRTITQDQLDGFSIDEDTNQLFWHDRAIVTPIGLPMWVQIAAVVGGFAGAVTALVNIIRLCLGK